MPHFIKLPLWRVRSKFKISPLFIKLADLDLALSRKEEMMYVSKNCGPSASFGVKVFVDLPSMHQKLPAKFEIIAQTFGSLFLELLVPLNLETSSLEADRLHEQINLWTKMLVGYAMNCC